MIVARPRTQKLKFDPIAVTPAEADVAYYVPYNPNNEETPEVVQSPSGSNWFPLPEGRLSAFISGRPGAGKSYLAKEFISFLPDDSDILLFTALSEEDGNFDEFQDRLYKIRMEPDNLSRLTLDVVRQHAHNPILLFDDIDMIRDKRVKEALYKLMNDALANGRGHVNHDGEGDIHVICTSHSANNYQSTKYMLENSEFVAIPPSGMPKAQWDLIMKKIGVPDKLSNEAFREGKRGSFRFIFVKQTAPMFMVYGNKITLI